MRIQVPFWAPQPPISCPKNAPPIRQLWAMHPPRPLKMARVNCLLPSGRRSRLDDFGRRCHFRTAYAYTLSWGPGLRYTGLLRDIYGPAQAFLVCPRCEFALSGFSIPVMHLVDSRPRVVKVWFGFCYACARAGTLHELHEPAGHTFKAHDLQSDRMSRFYCAQTVPGGYHATVNDPSLFDNFCYDGGP
jgi:hypothetical protein